MKLLRQEKPVLVILVILAFWFHWYLIRGNHFVFYYDQGRDAIISRQIIEKPDLKIQGPSASGTNEKIYNGVLYYYLVGPIYTLFQGNPLAPALFLSFLGALAVIPVFLLGKGLFRSPSFGFAAAFLVAFSTDAAQLSTWLSNPGLATWTVPFFYLFLWQSVIAKQSKFLPLTALFLGLSFQATLYAFYLLPVAVFLYLWQAKKQRRFFFLGKKSFFASLGVYLLTIGSMVVTQLKLLISGVYPLASLSLSSSGKLTWTQIAGNTWEIYLAKFQMALPFIFAPLLVYFFIKEKNFTKKLFFGLWLSTPILMFFIFSRGTYYSLAGLESGIYLLAGWAVLSFKRRFVTVLAVIFYLIFNFGSVQKIRQAEANSLTVQTGVFLDHMLAAVDQTYQQAEGSDFSISTLTEPYKYNTTWAYLYSWYGQNRYGYLPNFVGSDQTGIVGADYLQRQEKPESIHFSIYESAGPLKMFLPEFDQWQEEIAGPVTLNTNFGPVSVQRR